MPQIIETFEISLVDDFGMRAGNIRRIWPPRITENAESRMPKSRMVGPRSVTYWNATPFIPASYWNPEWRGKLEIAVPFLAVLIDNTACNTEVEMQMYQDNVILILEYPVKTSTAYSLRKSSKNGSIYSICREYKCMTWTLNRIGRGPSHAQHASHVKARTTPGLY